MPKRLLERQVSLLDYLTSREAIFGDTPDTPIDPALRGIDPALLRLEARFSHEKRMEKIAAVFPRTFALLGAGRERLVREFVDACPSVEISRVGNARAFHAFLCRRWRDEKPLPPYLPDVAACELACARSREAPETCVPDADEGTSGYVRRHPGVLLLRTGWDIRPVFEQSSQPLQQRDTRLAITLAADWPRVVEVASEVFDLLAALAQWTHPSAFDLVPDAAELIAELARSGLIEVRA